MRSKYSVQRTGSSSIARRWSATILLDPNISDGAVIQLSESGTTKRLAELTTGLADVGVSRGMKDALAKFLSQPPEGDRDRAK